MFTKRYFLHEVEFFLFPFFALEVLWKQPVTHNLFKFAYKGICKHKLNFSLHSFYNAEACNEFAWSISVSLRDNTKRRK